MYLSAFCKKHTHFYTYFFENYQIRSISNKRFAQLAENEGNNPY